MSQSKTYNYTADFHIHSIYSPPSFIKGYASRSSIQDILNIAKSRGLRAIAITDHNNITGSLLAHQMAKKMGIIAVPAVEVSSKSGHILAFNVTSQIKMGMTIRETVDKIHDEGGLAICAHPMLPIVGVGKKHIPKFDGVERINGRAPKQLPQKLIPENLFYTGGSDAHTLKEIGNTLTTFREPINEIEDILNQLKSRKNSTFKATKRRTFYEVIVPSLKNFSRYIIDHMY
ncbi:PHP-associated domain-containing protein [Nanoarchaeota archaeon]